MFRFAFPDLLYAYVLIPALGLFFWFAFRGKQRAIERFGDRGLMQKLNASVSRRRQTIKGFLLVVATGLVVTALARPQFGTRVETVKRRGQDIVIALDLSASMLAEDIAPNRLQKAKHAVGSLIDRLEGDRVGLVAFAGQAFVQSPLTVDYAAAKMFLDAMTPDVVPVPGTDLGAAMDRALDAFHAAGTGTKVLIIITDGEDHGEDITSRIARAQQAGVVVYTVGIGSNQGVPIPEFDAGGRRRGFKKDSDGSVVMTRLDEATLQTIAWETGGEYFHASDREDELALLADAIAGMADADIDAREFTQFEEQFQIFLGMALLLLTVEILVPERRRLDAAWRGRFQ